MKVQNQSNSNRFRGKGFIGRYQELIRNVVIPYQYEVLNDRIDGIEKSHAITNFINAHKALIGENDHDGFYGMVFQDSDVAKWIEAAAYSLGICPDSELERMVDEVIDIVADAQDEDGYLDTYFTIKDKEKRFTNLFEAHELYCNGHMIEAAVAYFEATGKSKLLNVMKKCADHIYDIFITGKKAGYPGHPEIELALMRLYRVTSEKKYLELAKHFIDVRGVDPEFFEKETKERDWNIWGADAKDTEYNQSMMPLRKQKDAVGHSVRAVYLYTAMADLASETDDKELKEACKNLWNSIVKKRMYITGGIGSTVIGEAFTVDYNLPNDTVYAETCASIGLMYFASRMLELEVIGEYADVMERAFYNTVLAGMQLDGKRFFYVNPLEVNPGVSGEIFGYKHVIPERPGWYACACCPPNLVRMVTSLGRYARDEDDDVIYSHLFIGQEARLKKADIKVVSEYPWKGHVSYSITPKTGDEFAVAIHIPGYLKSFEVTLNGMRLKENDETKADVFYSYRDGYIYIKNKWHDNDVIEISFNMDIRVIYANTKVREDIGCAALQRGPVVYAFEGVDNDDDVQSLMIDVSRLNEAQIETEAEGILKGAVLLDIPAVRLESSDALYSEKPPRQKSVIARAIPYYMWGNRGLNQMRVWMHTIYN